MKILNLNYEEANTNKRINKTKIIIASVILGVTVFVLLMYLLYICSSGVRNIFDIYILRKNVNGANLATIQLDKDSNQDLYAYSNYITILNNKVLSNYNFTGKLKSQLEVKVENPIYDSNNRFLVVGENEGNKIYLISGDKILWEKDLEGCISRICVNENGYLAVSLTGTTYKTVILLFDESGKELFKTYLSNNIASDLDISSDNKYLSFVEVNTSGIMVQSYVRTVDIEKAIKNSSEAVSETFTSDVDELIINIKYQDKNKLVCNTDKGIEIINQDERKVLMDFTAEDNIFYSGIKLKNSAYKINENNSGLLQTESLINIIDIATSKISTYNCKGTIKDVVTYNDKIVANLGNQIYCINTNGWLEKKFTSSSEIQNVLVCDSMIGIVHKDKIEIINL